MIKVIISDASYLMVVACREQVWSFVVHSWLLETIDYETRGRVFLVNRITLLTDVRGIWGQADTTFCKVHVLGHAVPQDAF